MLAFAAMWRWISRRRRERAEQQYQRGAALNASGDAHGAERHFRAALELDPRHVDAQIDLGVTLLAQGLPAAAERACRRALEMAPASLAAHVNLGSTLDSQGRLDEAVAAWKQALVLAPKSAQALSDLTAAQLRLRLGKAHLELGQAAAAIDSLREATRLDPANVVVWNALGHALDVQGDVDKALHCYEKALAVRPDDAQGHINRAGVWLARGEFAKGWDEFAWRERAPENAPVHARFELPRWDGSPLGGRSLLVYAEQGLGDQIMYASCLPEVIAQAGACTVECDARLAPLFRRTFPAARIHGGSQSDEPSWLEESPQLAVSIGNLPRFVRRSAGDFPRTAYLRADPGRVAAWRERLAQLGPGRKVGLSWRGGVPQTGRARRSIPLQSLTPVLETPGCTFISLQYGDAESHPQLRHWPEALADYDETAALVSALDLTVTVCTAVVHLAGALGRPAWVMAPVRPESRYGLTGESMPWYASIRMFRQEVFGDWNPVIARIAAELRRG